MNVYEAIQKTEELTDTINALELALSRLETNEFSKQRGLIIEVKQQYFKELKELEDRMKDTQIKPVVNIRGTLIQN